MSLYLFKAVNNLELLITKKKKKKKIKNSFNNGICHEKKNCISAPRSNIKISISICIWIENGSIRPINESRGMSLPCY